MRKEAVELARRELSKVRPANGNGKRGASQAASFEAFLEEYEHESYARFIERVVLKPNAKGKAGPKVDPSERVDVVGASEPYLPTFKKLKKRDRESLERHLARNSVSE